MGTLHALSQLILTKLQEVGIFTHCADEDTVNSCLRPTQNSPNLQLCGEHQGWDLSAGTGKGWKRDSVLSQEHSRVKGQKGAETEKGTKRRAAGRGSVSRTEAEMKTGAIIVLCLLPHDIQKLAAGSAPSPWGLSPALSTGWSVRGTFLRTQPPTQ